MRDKFKSRLVVMHGRLYILYPQLSREALIMYFGRELAGLTGMPCEVEVEL
jgi:hypothetical protein